MIINSQKRSFGKKSKVSLFTLGTMRATESFDKMYKMTKYAYYSGINHIETASSYGDAEILIGKASVFDYESKFGYILFLIPFVYFNIPLIFIVFFQIFLTAISGYCLYKISSKYFCRLSGIICVALFLFYLPIQIRNFYILTEMLFIDIAICL